jgi:serine/arginine repetitive matrix protein 2
MDIDKRAVEVEQKEPDVLSNQPFDADFPETPQQKEELPLPKSTKASPENAAKLSSDDDDMEFQEEDFAEHEMKFLREKTRLEAMKLDLSTREYRCTTPIERISTLMRIRCILPDIDFKSSEVEEDQESEVVKDAAVIPTPEGEEDVEMADDHQSICASPERMLSAEPNDGRAEDKGPPTPLSNPEQFFGNRFAELENILKPELVTKHNQAVEAELVLRTKYAETYRSWKQETRNLDKAQREIGGHMKQVTPNPEPTQTHLELPLPPLSTPTEGSRRHRIQTEYDIQQILELSRREYQEQQEKEADAAKQSEVDHEKEASIPNMIHPEEIRRRVYKDTNQGRSAKQALSIFEFAPPEDTFTEEEDKLLRELYQSNIKAWGKIATAMRERTGSKRTYKECINHYYATKWDKPYKKLPGRARRAGFGPRGKRAVRGRAAANFANGDGDTDMADSNGAEGSTPQVSETGRPRRAAAPKHFGEKDAEAAQTQTTGKTGASRGENGEPSSERPTRKGRGGKEKAPKRPRNQPLAARQPQPSPSKVEGKVERDERLLAEQPQPQAQEWRMAEMPTFGPEGEMKMPLLPAQQIDPTSTYHAHLEAAGLPTESRSRAYSNTQRAGASSYWSVSEETLFRDCLGYFGHDYQAIASYMETKTHTMVILLAL